MEQENLNQQTEENHPLETPPNASTPTAGVKNKISPSATILKRTAEKAATTGKRADLMEYLKARRIRK